MGLLWGHAARILARTNPFSCSAIPYTVWLISALCSAALFFRPGSRCAEGHLDHG